MESLVYLIISQNYVYPFISIEAEQAQLNTCLPICYNLVLETTGVSVYKAGDNIIL